MTLRDVVEWADLTPWVVQVQDEWCDAVQEAIDAARAGEGDDDGRNTFRLDE